MKSSPHIAILMATYNGEQFLSQQLDSFIKQNYNNWRLWVSDDGSYDNTKSILLNFQQRWKPEKLNIFDGPRNGASSNFLFLTAQSTIMADYFAWADQDDYWLPNKLSVAVAQLESYSSNKPLLYCGRTILTNDEGRDYGISPLLNCRPLNFSNALLQCVSGGNTMVFNQAARILIAKGALLNIFSHDWWAYQIICGSGGQIIYDPCPLVKYRQHKLNLVGTNRGLIACFNRLRKLINGDFRRCLDTQLKALESIATTLSEENRKKIAALSALRSLSNPLKRLKVFASSGFYRQSTLEQFILYLAILSGRA
jgi:glycosyltransferase involved in cell wall biosynthesis